MRWPRRTRRLDWSSASSLEDLGELTARYLAGEADESPTYAGSVNPETAEILGPLTALNRAGLVTDMSQPACRYGEWVQRAAVAGFCSADLAGRLSAACADADLGFTAVAPGERPRRGVDRSREVIITMRNGRPYTGLGAPDSTRALRRLWEPELSRDGLAALLGAHAVYVHDPEWTALYTNDLPRENRLWDVLTGAVATEKGERDDH